MWFTAHLEELQSFIRSENQVRAGLHRFFTEKTTEISKEYHLTVLLAQSCDEIRSASEFTLVFSENDKGFFPLINT